MNIDRFPFANQTATLSPLWHYATGAFSLLCLLCGSVTNGLVIFVFTRNSNLRRPRNYLLINLAVTDMGLLWTNNTFHVIASFNKQWPFGRKGCDLYGFCGGVFGLTSIVTMAVISLTRLTAVIDPFSSLKLTGHFILKCIAWSWMYGSLWMIPPLLGWNRFIFEGFGTTCTFDYISTGIWDRLYMMALVIGGFLVPLLIIIVSYTIILVKLSARSRQLMNKEDRSYELQLRQPSAYFFQPICSINDGQSRSESNTESGENNQVTENLRRTEARATRTALLVCAMYCIAWGPYTFMTLLSHFGVNYVLNAYTTAMLGLFTKTAACVNPLIYAFCSSSFHRKICLCLKCTFSCRERFQPLSLSNYDLNRTNLNIKISRAPTISD